MSVSNSKIRIVIVEDHGLMRECLHLAFADEDRFEIVGEAGNGVQAIDVIDGLQPDVVLLDISIPEISGLELLPLIKQRSPGTKVLMLTGKDDEEVVVKALKEGAKGYLSKNTSCKSLIKSIKIVHGGDLWIERRLIVRLFEESNAVNSNADSKKDKNQQSLTPREQEVLRCLASGGSNKEIAKVLSISEKTVKSHLNNIFKKAQRQPPPRSDSLCY